MTDVDFWRVIALLDWSELGDDDAVLAPAVAALAAQREEDIVAFDDRLAEKLFALDTREHARGTYSGEIDPDDGDEYISADDFLYRRCAGVASGKDTYERILAHPEQMSRDHVFEALLGLAAAAFEEKTGREYEHVSDVSYESFSNAEGWKPTAATRPGRFTGDGIPAGNRRPT